MLLTHCRPNLKLPTKRIALRPHYYAYQIVFVEVPIIDHIDARILKRIESDKTCKLRMETYHTCGTVHCIGGWIIDICGAQGYELEMNLGHPQEAADAIYRESTGKSWSPDFSACHPYPGDPGHEAWASFLVAKNRQGFDRYGMLISWDDFNLEQLRKRAAADPLPSEELAGVS